MSDPFGLGQTEEELRRWVSQFAEQGDKLIEQSERLKDQLANATATVSSPNGIVTVTVGASGELQDVEFSDRVGKVSPSELRSALMNAVQQAKAEVGNAAADAVEPFAGNSDVMEFIRSQLPPLQENKNETAQQRSEPDEDEDFDDRTFLR